MDAGVRARTRSRHTYVPGPKPRLPPTHRPSGERFRPLTSQLHATAVISSGSSSLTCAQTGTRIVTHARTHARTPRTRARGDARTRITRHGSAHPAWSRTHCRLQAWSVGHRNRSPWPSRVPDLSLHPPRRVLAISTRKPVPPDRGSLTCTTESSASHRAMTKRRPAPNATSLCPACG